MHNLIGKWLIDKYYNTPCPYRRNSDKNTKVAVLVETRPSFFLPLVIENFASVLGDDWNFHLFLTPEVADFVSSKLQELECAVTILNCKGRFTVSDYSALLLSMSFWDLLQEENILIFQTDTLVLQDVPEWALQYDLIGAPCGEIENDLIYNGGLSIRSKSAMLQVLRDTPPKAGAIEDVYFSQTMRASGLYKLPSLQEAACFSAESIVVDRPIGMHGTDKFYISTKQIQQLLSNNK